MDDRTRLLSLFDLWEQIDAAQLDGIRINSQLSRLFWYFDSVPDRPLTDNEFYGFVFSWNADDVKYYMTYNLV